MESNWTPTSAWDVGQWVPPTYHLDQSVATWCQIKEGDIHPWDHTVAHAINAEQWFDYGAGHTGKKGSK